MTTWDEDWTEGDMVAALEWSAEQGLRCSGCGGFTDETMAPGADDNYDAQVLVCHRCAAGDRAAKAYREADGPTAGIKVHTREAD